MDDEFSVFTHVIAPLLIIALFLGALALAAYVAGPS